MVTVDDVREFVAGFPRDIRFNWVHVRLAAIDVAEMRELGGL